MERESSAPPQARRFSGLPVRSGPLIATLVVAALGLTGAGIFLTLRSPAAKSTNATPSPSQGADPAVTALGRLEPGGEVFCLYPPSSSGSGGRVQQLMVREGDRVQQNQMLAVMDTAERLQASVTQAEAQVQEAEIKIKQAQTGGNASEFQFQAQDVSVKEAQIAAKDREVERWKRSTAIALKEMERYEVLRKDKVITDEEFDRRRTEFEAKRNNLDLAEQEVIRLRSELAQSTRSAVGLRDVRPVDVEQARAQRDVAIANLKRAIAERNTAAVVSPIEGKVLKVHAKQGEQVSSMGGNTTSDDCSGIVELGRTDQMYAVAEVYETDIAKVKRGHRAEVTSSALGTPLTGVVELVGLKIAKGDPLNTDPAADTDTRVVEVKIRLDNSQVVENLTNLQVKVKIDTNSTPLPLPKGAGKPPGTTGLGGANLDPARPSPNTGESNSGGTPSNSSKPDASKSDASQSDPSKLDNSKPSSDTSPQSDAPSASTPADKKPLSDAPRPEPPDKVPANSDPN